MQPIRYYINLIEANVEDEKAHADRLQRARDMGFGVDDPHYFGTPNGDFDELDLDRTPDENLAYGRGAYASRDPEAASGYAHGISWGNKRRGLDPSEITPTVYKVYMRVKNPFDMDKNYPYAEAKRIFAHCFTDKKLKQIEFWVDLAKEAEDHDYIPEVDDDDRESESEWEELQDNLMRAEDASAEELGIDPDDYEDGENDAEFQEDLAKARQDEVAEIQHRIDHINKMAEEHHENHQKAVASGHVAASRGKDIYTTLWQNTDDYHDWKAESQLFGGETETFEFKTQANEWLEELGYDGLRHVDQFNPGRGKPHVVTIAFHPHQVRSAHAQFDPDKSDSPKLSEQIIKEMNMSIGQSEFFERESEMADKMYREYKSGTPSQPWKLVPAARIIAIWKNAAKTGFVRDERGLNAIANQMIENTIRLYINTELAGHGNSSSKDVLERLGLDDIIEDGEVEKFVDWAVDYPGGWRISDYGLEPLMKFAMELLEGPSVDDMLVIIDKMLNVTHQRSDMASWFVEGGTRTLNRLRDDERPNKINEGLNSLQCDPIYEHDCPMCVFCGQTAFRGHNVVDVYVCNPSRPNMDEMSIVVRYSDEPGEYSSRPYGMAKNTPAYHDAIELVDQRLKSATP
jgi:hypothetical protein